MDFLPKSEAEDRLLRIQRWMRQSSVDAVFVLQNADLYYFSGTVQVGVLALPASGEPVYLVQKSLTRAKTESPWERLVPMSQMRKAPDLLTGEGIGRLKRIGLEMDVLPTSYYLRFQSLFSGAEFVDASDAIRTTRMIKSPYEIDSMRQAATMLDRAYSESPEWIHPGATELEVSARLEEFLRLQGHQGLTRMRGFNYEISYGTISSGPTASYPTCFPGPVGFIGLYPAIPNGGSRRQLTRGHTIMADIVGGYGGYIADKTRTYAVGDPDRDMAGAHAFILELMREIESLLAPSASCAEIYRRALERVKDSPYAATFMGVGDGQVRFVGHGVGLELDELPVLAPGVEMPLQAGMTIAIEPKIFFPDRGGVGIEDTYLITEQGFEKLTDFPEEIVTVR